MEAASGSSAQIAEPTAVAKAICGAGSEAALAAGSLDHRFVRRRSATQCGEDVARSRESFTTADGGPSFSRAFAELDGRTWTPGSDALLL